MCLLLKEVDKLVNVITAEVYVKQMERMSNVHVPLRAVSKTQFAWIHINLIIFFYQAPNPINGCLCEVINSCSCVASHLQEVQDTESQSPSFSEISLSSSCHISKPPKLYKSKSTSNQPFIPTLNEPSGRVKSSNDTLPLIDDTDLMNFLVNDLDKYTTATSKNILDIDQHHPL